MFENYVIAKTTKARKWVTVLITTSVILHVVVGAAFIIRSFWIIEKLTTPKEGVMMAIAAPPPPPPAAAPPGKKQEPKPNTVKKVLIEDTVQPIKVKEEDIEVEIVTSDEVGVSEGIGGGSSEGLAIGSLEGLGKLPSAAPPPPPPPAPPPPPQIVPPKALEAQRVAGNPQIEPDEVTKTQIARANQTQVVTTVKMCLNVSGAVSSLNFLKSSGFPSYDRKIRAEMNQWRYSPFTINGKPVPACSVVTFIYRQS